MDIAYWIRTERFTEPNRAKPLKKTGVDIHLKIDKWYWKEITLFSIVKKKMDKTTKQIKSPQ